MSFNGKIIMIKSVGSGTSVSAIFKSHSDVVINVKFT